VTNEHLRRVCLLGGESSGKSTLAEALARAYGTRWVPEYGRQLWEERRGVLAPGDMVLIAERQIAAERETGGRHWLFCDTSPLTTLFYSRELFGAADPRLEALAGRAYDVTLLCAPDFPFVQDGTRRDPAFRDQQHAWYRRELAARGVPYLLVGGSLAERVAQVRGAL
jgi:HTH-type transcriptional regulator, transcriptional repressor of NAD biosynthesis genes